MVPWNPESARGLDNSFAYHDTGSSMATILTAETSRLCLPKHWPIPQNGVINRERQLANATAMGILYLSGPTWKLGSELWHLTEVSSYHIYKISGQVNYLKAPFCVFDGFGDQVGFANCPITISVSAGVSLRVARKGVCPDYITTGYMKGYRQVSGSLGISGLWWSRIL